MSFQMGQAFRSPWLYCYYYVLSLPHSGVAHGFWRTARDSNPRHLVLETSVLPTELAIRGGSGRIRTGDPRLIKTVLYQLSYTTEKCTLG